MLDYLGMVFGISGEEVNVLRNRIIRSSIFNKVIMSVLVVVFLVFVLVV